MGHRETNRALHKAYLELRSIARELDPERPVTYAENHLKRARRQHTVALPDIWGVNFTNSRYWMTPVRSGRTENVLVSECGNHTESIRGDDRQELMQVAVIERDWELMADRRFVAGHTIWCLADYATEHRKRFVRRPGLLARAACRPKMAAELFRARYTERPFVSLHITEPGPAAPPTR